MANNSNDTAPDPVGFNHSVPYPEAPEVDHDDEEQEHYRGARDPELAKRPFRDARRFRSETTNPFLDPSNLK